MTHGCCLYPTGPSCTLQSHRWFGSSLVKPGFGSGSWAIAADIGSGSDTGLFSCWCGQEERMLLPSMQQADLLVLPFLFQPVIIFTKKPELRYFVFAKAS